jgi:hypothetical protein
LRIFATEDLNNEALMIKLEDIKRESIIDINFNLEVLF